MEGSIYRPEVRLQAHIMKFVACIMKVRCSRGPAMRSLPGGAYGSLLHEHRCLSQRYIVRGQRTGCGTRPWFDFLPISVVSQWLRFYFERAFSLEISDRFIFPRKSEAMSLACRLNVCLTRRWSTERDFFVVHSADIAAALFRTLRVLDRSRSRSATSRDCEVVWGSRQAGAAVRQFFARKTISRRVLGISES